MTLAQFDAFRNTSKRPGAPPFLVVVQSSRFQDVPRRVAVPLVRREAIGLIDARLSPEFMVDGIAVVLATLELASLPLSAFGERVANLNERGDDIVRAIDLVLSRAWD